MIEGAAIAVAVEGSPRPPRDVDPSRRFILRSSTALGVVFTFCMFFGAIPAFLGRPGMRSGLSVAALTVSPPSACWRR
jgi:hypothetical protein